MTQQRPPYKAPPDAARWFLHTPAETSSRYVEWAENLKADQGITFGCILDRSIIPLHPGDMMAVVARPGHGKSSFMAYMARRVAQDIMRRRAGDKECVVYISWEQPVEELEAFFQSGNNYTSTDLAWGRVDLETVRRGAIQRIDLPIWMLGHSIKDANRERPPMTVDMVFSTIRSLYDEFKRVPRLICLDYIQRIPVQSFKDRFAQVAEATYESKQLAVDVGCPVIAGVQAGRQVDGYKNPIPSMADAQYSSAIEQTADKQIALWRPSKTEEEADPNNRREMVNIGKHPFAITPDLLVIRILKQRFDIGSGTYAISFKPQSLEVHDFDVVHLNYEEREVD